MALSAGTRLGPYEIVAPIGAGGMGEVYRARDTRLGREVALKVLPEELANDPDRLRRFEQEARTVSALNHPNIVVLHDIGRADSVSYLAMELVGGRSLREHMAPGPLPAKRTLLVGAQIAEGLARAHASGIVHRDLKPENVMLTEEGTVKILDFGLAKVVFPSLDVMTSAPTTPASAGTQAGVILGTAGYMSPEQAAGQPADHRSDQFALGSILYEMLAGRRAFERRTAAETLAAIIREDPPPVVSVAPGTPAPLGWIVERCLAKEPAERYESTRDLARDLANLHGRLADANASFVAQAAERHRKPIGRLLPWILSAFLLAGLLMSVRSLRREAPAPKEVIRFSISVPEGIAVVSSEVFTNSAVSPDGRALALVGWSGGRSRLYLRSLDSQVARVLPGSEGGVSPFWSPDGRNLAFFAEGKLKRIGVDAGPPQTICDASWEGVGTWSPRGRILFAEAVPGREGIYEVSVGSGSLRRVTIPDASRGERFHFWPHFLPDGRQFLFVAIRPGGESGTTHEVRIGSVDSSETTSLAPIDSRIEYSPPGFLLYVEQGTLLARPFDAEALKWTGDARPVVQGIHYFFGPANAGFSVSKNGMLAYERGMTSSRVVWMDRNGKEMSPVASLEYVDQVRLSSDGGHAALSVGDPRFGTSDIWVHDLSRNVSTRLTSSPDDEQSPVWAPDGTRIVYRSDRGGPPDLYDISSVGAGAPRLLLAKGGVQTPQDFSRDGRSLIFGEADRNTGLDLWLLPVGEQRKASPVLRTRFDEDEARVSPDGRWIAYDSNESGRSEIYVTSREGGGRIRVSTDGGFSPRWRADGQELFYATPARGLMAVRIRSTPRFEAGLPVELFRVASGLFSWDVNPNGERFLVSIAAKTPDPPITMVVGWREASGVQ
jgi:serine/threonine protein kinase